MVVLAGTLFKADSDIKTTKLGMWNAHLYLKRPGQIMVYFGTVPLIAATILTLLSLGGLGMQSVFSIRQPHKRFLFGASVSAGSILVMLAASALLWSASLGGLELLAVVCLIGCALLFAYIFYMNWTAWQIATRWNPLELRIEDRIFHGFPMHRCDILDARKPLPFDLGKARVDIIPAANEAIKIQQGPHTTRISASDRFVRGTYQDLKASLLQISAAQKGPSNV